MIPKTNDFEQAGARWRSFDEARQNRFAMRVAGTYSGKRMDDKVKEIWMGYWRNADANLADLIQSYMDDIQ